MDERREHQAVDPVQQQERQEKLGEAMSLLERGIEGILDSQGFANYLRTMAHFHTFSFNNVAVMLAQRPEATPGGSTGTGPTWTARAPRPKGGRGGWPQSHRSWQAGHETARDWRPPRNSAGQSPDGREPPRQQRLRGVDRRRARDPAALGAAAQAPSHAACRHGLRHPPLPPFLLRRHIGVRIARKGIESSQRRGRHRWVIDRTLAWLSRYRRLTIRYERREDIHQAFLTLGCALICFNHLPRGEG